MTTAFSHVFSPFRIGGVELRNRIFVPAHTTNYGVDREGLNLDEKTDLLMRAATRFPVLERGAVTRTCVRDAPRAAGERPALAAGRLRIRQ